LIGPARRGDRLVFSNGIVILAALAGDMLIVVLITKFTYGAYLVVIAMPAIFVLMKRIQR
jgi:O-antigen ligase